MAKVKIQGHASGTGVLTVTAPNTSTDRTITLPDATGTLLNSDGDGSSLTGVGVAGITSSADATAITIDSSERVGIGTGSPLTNSLLHIQSNASSGVSAINNGLLLVENNTGVGIGLLSNNDRQQTIAFGDPEDNDVGFINYGHDTNQMSFNVNAAERMRITANGVTFNGDTAAANALDDYEYGTWTPANQWIALTNNETARYVKIGSLVTVWGNVTWASSPADTSQTGGKIQGLPYTPIGGDFPWLPSHWVNTSTGARKDDSEYDYYLDNSTTMTIYSRPNSRVVQRQQVSGTQMKFIATFTTD